MQRLKRWLDKKFELEEINGYRCPTYMYRWTLLNLQTWSMYLHHFVDDDWCLDLHDHPKRFISIGLWGRYRESTPQGERVYRAPWIRTFPATHIHRIGLIGKRPCWTIVIVLRPVREWGFWNEGRWIHWRRYVNSETADKRTACN